LCALLFGMGLVRRLVPTDRRSLAGLAFFAVLGCNIYHLYFTTIPKTYSLGTLFLMAGLLLILVGMERAVAGDGLPRYVRMLGRICLFAGGLSLAFATGTRISLLLVLPVVGFTLLLGFRRFGWSFLWYGLGGVFGLALTYGPFALDPASLKGLLAAQSYHAARGGFDPFFALGSVSRLVRGYAALGVVLLALPTLGRPRDAFAGLQAQLVRGTGPDVAGPARRAMLWMLGLGFAAVFLLQLSAPFPYDDYQVPAMGLLAVVIVAAFARRAERPVAAAWLVVVVSCMVSFASPLLQEWATYGQDRFWSVKKEQTELAKLRAAGRRIEELDPKGTTLLTQDLYLAIETGRTVPAGLEMGPFSYFPELPTAEAEAVHVLNRERAERLLASAPCPLAALSGYAFAIAAPSCAETPAAERTRLLGILATRHRRVEEMPRFGQNATCLEIYRRIPAAEGTR